MNPGKVIYLPIKHLKKDFNRLFKYILRNYKILRLLNKKYKQCSSSRVWVLKPALSNYPERDENIDIFTQHIPHENINWLKDYSSGYEYPLLRFDKLKFHLLFNKGIDIIFPWEVSRCQFLIAWGQNYYNTRSIDYYGRFRSIILSWISRNPFLYGVNWTSPMDASIRATNWIIGCELFNDQFQNDEILKEKITVSLQQHADYILQFMERRGNNHEVSYFAGLLFISSFLMNNRSQGLRKKAIRGIERCIQSQVFNDGVDCEFSTCYHRLVLEMFSYSAILARAINIEFSDNYYKALFKMFEFVASYIDHKGNAPQIGDNDSGRFLVFHDSHENDHSYLLEIGNRIYNYEFLSQLEDIKTKIISWLPDFKQVDPPEITRETDKNIGFLDAGFYFLKNTDLSVSIIGNVINKNSVTGHKHFDFGSFTVAYKGIPIIIDSGTFTYTPNLDMRNSLKGLHAHNVPFPDDIYPEMYEISEFFGLGNKWPIISEVDFKNSQISFTISYDMKRIKREISINKNAIFIKDTGTSIIKSHLHTRLNFTIDENLLKNDIVAIETNTNRVLSERCNYSERYGHISDDCTRIIVTNEKEINMKILLL